MRYKLHTLHHWIFTGDNSYVEYTFFLTQPKCLSVYRPTSRHLCAVTTKRSVPDGPSVVTRREDKMSNANVLIAPRLERVASDSRHAGETYVFACTSGERDQRGVTCVPADRATCNTSYLWSRVVDTLKQYASPSGTFLQAGDTPPPGVALSWHDPTLCNYEEQIWAPSNARRTGICALSGLKISKGDSIYKPRLRGAGSPLNSDALILASELKRSGAV
jgi:hypothetical protein